MNTVALALTLIGGPVVDSAPQSQPAPAVATAEPEQAASEPTEIAWEGYPYLARTVDVAGHRMRYVEEGRGDPILMLHGIPTHGYLWRNVIGGLSDRGRVIVPDLMGFGGSYQGPELTYDPRSQQNYFDGFMEVMSLDNITLASTTRAQFWRSTGHRAIRTGSKGIVLAEAVMLDARSWWKYLPLSMKLSLLAMQNPRRARKLIVDRNVLIDKSLGLGARRDLTDQEMAAYRAPFSDPEVRERVLLHGMAPSTAPVRGRSQSPDDSGALTDQYADWLRDTPIPKLLLHAKPG